MIDINSNCKFHTYHHLRPNFCACKNFDDEKIVAKKVNYFVNCIIIYFKEKQTKKNQKNKIKVFIREIENGSRL